MRWTQEEIVRATGARVLVSCDRSFAGVGTDTRADLRDRIFIALKGDTFDAHDFLAKAVETGAGAVILHRQPSSPLPGGIGVYLVPDTLRALQEMGAFARRRSRALFLALTGSNGKTTTKEFASALIGSVLPTHASVGSFNNHWGVPLTLLDLDDTHQIAVIEMGMNHAGEITELVRIADPDVVLCTTVGRAHIEHFGEVSKIAEAKEEIYLAAKPGATRIFSLDNEWTVGMFERSQKVFPKAPKMTFSSKRSDVDVHLRIVRALPRRLEISGVIDGVGGNVDVEVFGEHNLTNLMAAAAMGLSAGLRPGQVWEGLRHCRTGWGRNQIVALKSGAEMIFDAYNANPDSMGALVRNVSQLSVTGRKLGVFGQMLELGESSAAMHRELGEAVGRAGFDRVVFFGADHAAFCEGVQSAGRVDVRAAGAFEEGLAQEMAASLDRGDLVVVKGSRGNRLERFVPMCEPLDFQPKK